MNTSQTNGINKNYDALVDRQRDAIQICFICDDGYAMYTNIAVTSIIENKESDTKYDIYIIASNLSEQNIASFKTLAQKDIGISIIQINDFNKYDHLYKKGFPVTTTAIFKFDLPSLLPKLDKVLYLDGDIIVQHGLQNLYKTDINSVYAGVISDYRGQTLKGNYKSRLNTNNKIYFNSGVLLLNLDLMRKDNISEKLLDYRINGINYYMDQDAFNMVFAEKIKVLSFNYNFQMTCWRFMTKEQLQEYYHLPGVNDKYEYIKNAVILHYTAEKPWIYYDGKCSEIWMHYFLHSNFSINNLKRKSILEKCHNELDKNRIYQNRLTNPLEYALQIKTPLVSVIMPVYNSEKYIGTALCSLRKQTLVDFEVICVNDASTDNTLEVLKTYANIDPRIRVISLDFNQGAGVARNTALEIAQGEYITFLDADDYLPVHALEYLYQTGKSVDADFIFAQTKFDNGSVLSSSYKESYIPQKDFFSPDDITEYLLSVTHGGPSGKMLKRSFIQANNLHFLETARSEDFFFFNTAIIQSKRIVGIKEPLYVVVSHANPQSLEHTKDETPLIFWSCSLELRNWLKTNNLYTKYKRTFINSSIVRVCHNINSLKTINGIIQLYNYINEQILNELEFSTHSCEYFYESSYYNELQKISQQPVEELIVKLIGRLTLNTLTKSSTSLNKDQNYWRGVRDTQASKTYLVGRVVTWFPKQIRKFYVSINKNGIQKTVKKTIKKVRNLPNALRIFRNVWNQKTAS